LRVSPRARRSEVVGRHGDAWKVRVAAPPEGGRANDEALALVADAAAVPRTRVTLVARAASRDKVVEIAGVESGELDRRLRARSARKDETL
jgi:uncharacterized protein YggU (UPF0235/DUF167 family)